MRTTVVLDDKLVAEAREVLGAPTLRALVEMALPAASPPSREASGYFCAIFPQQDTVRLSFEWGVLLHDEHGLLRPGGKQVRYLELAPEDALSEAHLIPLLGAASLKARGKF